MPHPPPAHPSSAPRRGVVRPRELGQASIEHVAVVALVLLVVSGGAAAARAWAPNLTNAVTAAVRRALCVAGGDRCAEFHRDRACVVSAGERRQHAETTVLVRVGRDGALLRDERSDGTVALTWIDDVDVGLIASIGGGGEAGGTERTGGADEGGASETALRARAEGGLGIAAGRRLRWELPSRSAADALQRRIVRWGDAALLVQSERREIRRLVGGGTATPPSDAYAVRLGGRAEAEGALSLPAALEAKLGGRSSGAAEVWWDRRRRRGTIAVEATGGLEAGVAGPLGARLGGRVEGMQRRDLVLDERGVPLELVLRGRLAASAEARSPRAGRRKASSAGGGGARWNLGEREFEAHLDLTDPALASTAEALVTAVRDRRRGDAGRALRELGGHVAAEAAIDVRRYETSTTRRPWSAEIAGGIKVGLEMETSRTRRRLVEARTRRPGGLWEERLDCGVRGGKGWGRPGEPGRLP